MNKRLYRHMLLGLIVSLLICVFPIRIYAAETTLSGLKYSDVTVSGTTITMSVSKAKWSGEASKTVTITNTLSSSALVTFEYSHAPGTGSGDKGSATINPPADGKGKIESNDGSTCVISLKPQGSFSVKIVADDDWGRLDSSSYHFYMYNPTVEPFFDSTNLTVQYDNSQGVVTYKGNSLSTGAVLENVAANETLTASPKSGWQFVGWMDDNGKILSKNETYILKPTAANMTAVAVFAQDSPWFYVNNTYLIEGWDAAMAYSGKVVLANTATLAAREAAYNVPSNVEFLIPFSDADPGAFGAIPENSTIQTNESGAPTCFRTLTVAPGAKITVAGKMNVNGQRNVASQGKKGTGAPKGGHAVVDLQGTGTQLTVNSGAVLTCYGFIKGSGGVNMIGGSTLHELLQVFDWSGGSNLLSWYTSLGRSSSETLFFVSHYYMQNVEAPLTINYGSKLYAEAVLTVSGTQVVSSAQAVGKTSENALFMMGEGTTLTRTYSPTTDRVEYSLTGNGSATVGSLTISAQVGVTVNLSSSDFTLPVNNAMTIRIGEGVKASLSNRAALMPGSRMIIENGGRLDLNSYLFILDKADRQSTLFFDGGLLAPAYTASRGTASKITTVDDSAYLEVKGTLNIGSNGGIFTTTGGSNADKIVYGTGQIIHGGKTSGAALRAGFTRDYTSFGIGPAVLNLAGDGDMQPITKATYIGLGADHGNKWYINTEKVAATCVDDAYTKYYCSSADKFYKTDVVADSATGHTEVTDAAVAPTCTETGLTEGKHCSVCEEVLVAQDVVDATGHTDEVIVTAPTCTTGGNTTYTCTVCGDVRVTDEKEATGHTMKWTVTKLPTCEEEGSQHGECLVCDYTEDKVEAALGHSLGEWIVDTEASCETAGSKHKECANCEHTETEEIPEKGHTEGETVVENNVAPDCENTGSYDNVVYCTVCGEELSREKVTVDALGHSYDNGVVTTPATCTEAGVKTFTCATCGGTKTEEVKATGHTEVTVTGTPATCTATGLTEGKKCSVCGVTTVTQDVIPKLEHDYEAVVTAPTCTEKGYTTYTCACGETYTGSEVAAKGHTEAEAVTENEKAATCSAEGSYESVVYCSVCGVEVSRTTVEIKKLAHTPVVDEAVEATCTATGKTEGSHCGVCNETLVKQEEVAMKPHTEVEDEAKAPTCTETGLTVGKHCLVCNKVLVAQTTVNATGHTEVTDKAKAPTCTETGLTEGKHCSVCNKVLVKQEEVAMAAHTEEVIPAVAATCTATGLTEGKKCSVCDKVLVEQKEVPMAAHTEEVIPAVAATCTATGLTEGKKCSVCDKVLVEQKEVPMAAHTEETLPAVAATCTATGLTEGKKCSVCKGVLVEQTVVPMAAHTEEVIPAVAATCTATGLTEGKKCSVCKDVLVEQTVTEMIPHTAGERRVENTNPATCTADGSYEQATYCTKCGHEMNRETVTISSVGHQYVNTVTPPTCTAAGYTTHTCKACGDSYIDTEVEAPGHKWDDGVVTKAPTTTEEGVMTYTCSVCKDTKAEAIEKLEIVLDPIIDKTVSGETPATITAPVDGWKLGENTFEVSSDVACIVACAEVVDGKSVYTRIDAVKVDNTENTYNFTVELTEDTQIIVAIAGDVNESGIADSSDVMLISRSRVDTDHRAYRALSDWETIVGDVNNSSIADSSDVMLISRSRVDTDHRAYATIKWTY